MIDWAICSKSIKWLKINNRRINPWPPQGSPATIYILPRSSTTGQVQRHQTSLKTSRYIFTYISECSQTWLKISSHFWLSSDTARHTQSISRHLWVYFDLTGRALNIPRNFWHKWCPLLSQALSVVPHIELNFNERAWFKRKGIQSSQHWN